jgi:hypothetical protein
MKAITFIFLLIAGDFFSHKSRLGFTTAIKTTSAPSLAYCEYVPNQCWMSNDTSCIGHGWPSSPYFGTKNESINGHSCEVWASNSPHVNVYPYTGNECRDPDGGITPWCYTTNPDVRWDLCFQPKDSCGCKNSVRN